MITYLADCPKAIDSHLLVSSTSTTYNALGEFYCADDGVLFLSGTGNKTTNESVCNATAQWSRQDEIDCYTSKGTYKKRRFYVRVLLLLFCS